MTEHARVDNGIVDIIRSAFEGKPVDAEAAFNSAMQSKMSLALQARSDQIRADVYGEDEHEEDLEASDEIESEEPEENEEVETEDSTDEDV